MTAIVNVTENWGIGLDNQLLVSISADLKRFRELTTGKTVILGRKTLETFPGGLPLKNRTNIILTANRAFTAGDAVIVHSEEELLAELKKYPLDDLCVIGGGSVYRLLLDYCDRVQVTKTHMTCHADAFFPNLDALPNWQVAWEGEELEDNGLRFQYTDYVNQNTKEL